ncbi:MAG: methyltransferase domain-containing protein, partial [Chloroflexota bacterium]|nr:methyltransferase domain-containing protein [Chloroflexota bacterium]
ISYRRAREALPEGGSTLDIGAGAGAASLPLLDRAGTLVAVDQDEPLLRELLREAGDAARRVRLLIGAWPAVAAAAPVADVVVCHHVLYNVPDLRPFVDALSAHARRRVVIEITARHPLSRLNPLWQRLHGITRPTRPTWEDAAKTLAVLIDGVNVERQTFEAEPMTGNWEELVAFTARRLCVGPAHSAAVEAGLREIGADPADPATWLGTGRDVVTLWWDTSGGAAPETA